MDTKALVRGLASVAGRILRAGLIAGAEAVLNAARAELEVAVATAERKA